MIANQIVMRGNWRMVASQIFIFEHRGPSAVWSRDYGEPSPSRLMDIGNDHSHLVAFRFYA